MLSRKLLRKLLNSILEEQGVKLRTSKGYNASHPVINRKPFMLGLGDSDYKEIPEKIKKRKKKPVEISKAFEEEEFKEYETILEGLLNGKTIH
jgi:hypothetical protein